MPSSLQLLGAFAVAATATADLQPASEMTNNCFDYPTTNFNRNNCVKGTYGSSPQTGGLLDVGDSAFDFTLYDVDGNEYTLSTMLEEKPVALIWGMWTCPAYQGMGTSYPFDQCGYKDEWDLVESYKDTVTFVHLVGPEPHPLTPDTNFDSGKQLMNYWSTVRQAKTYDDRITMTKKVLDYTHPSQILLPDLLSDNPYDSESNQPVWCSMGLGARTAMLISQEGTLEFEQDWFRSDDFATAIDSYFAGTLNSASA